MNFRPLVELVLFAVYYPFHLIFTTVRRVLNFVLTIVARALFLDRIVNRMAAWLVRRSDLFFSRHGDPLLNGNLLAYAEEKYPRDKFPTAWEDIPDDVRHELVWDGRLLNGDRVAELAKAKITDEVVGQALARSGIHALALTLIVASIPMYLYAIDSGRGIGGLLGGHTPFPSWAWDNGAMLPVASWVLLTVLERVMFLVQLSITTGLLFLAFPLFWFFAFAAAMNSAWNSASAPYRVATRDSEVFWKSNILTRQNQYKAYCREVENACYRLKDQPIIPVGEATGLIRGRGDMEAPDRGTIVSFDGESIRQHALILGGTGSGKTRLVIRPLFERLMNAAWGPGHKIGAYVTDGKGTLWKDLAPVVAHRDDIAILGTAEGQFGLDLCQGMSPLEISTTFKAVAGQLQGASKEDFWPESASLLLMHSATLARALQLSEAVCEIWKDKRSCMPYSLIGIAQIASNTNLMLQCFDDFSKMAAILDDEEANGVVVDPEITTVMAAADKSIEWLNGSHMKQGDNTRGSVVANVSSVLGKLSGAPDITERFCSGAYKKMVDVDHALKGGILFIAVGETEHGMAGKVVTCWLKTRLYIMARRRLIDDPEGCENTSCALIADEYQMLATIGPDSCATFFNIARQTGVFMVAATQSVAALNQAIGEHATANLMNLLRSKIILKTEERSTLEYAKALAGEVARGWEYEPGFYATQAIRQLEYGASRKPVVSVGGFEGLFPAHFEASTAQQLPYSSAHLAAMWARASNPVGNGTVDTGDGGESQNMQQMASREEDQNRQSFVGSLQMRPKIDTDELLVGSGMAFAIIQRAGGDRMDVIDLDIAA
ncbi:type IV secretory system conjugative DNA transfer family protein [Agrobacterium radiobacter]|uniref:type IV secretory system conjugative DNA transfer family protein n=1 Tax=Agrobacterium radiobacter TaxID=362 RepID=UPI003CE4ACB2